MSMYDDRRMKKIQNPSAGQLMWILLPTLAMLIVAVVERQFAVWMIVVIIVDYLIYMAFLTYFCIKQQCRKQMIVNWIGFLIICGYFIASRLLSSWVEMSFKQ